MNTIWNTFIDTLLYVLGTLWHNMPVLAIGILAAGAMQVYVNTDKMRGWLMRRSSISIPASVAFGAFTPFCACGTMAVVLSMMATALPWGAIMAFLTSSPLMSPDGFILISGIISPGFAIALAAASIFIGLSSGYIAHMLQKKTHFLDHQLRFSDSKTDTASVSPGCSHSPALSQNTRINTVNENISPDLCNCDMVPDASDICCAAVKPQRYPERLDAFIKRLKINKMLKVVFDLGIKKILPLFAVFAGVGYLINRFIPAEWIGAVFGAQNALAVPLSALIGLPLYINGDSAIPLIKSLMQSGVSPGVMLAFLITGPGTSAGVLAGIATIMKRKAVMVYTACLLFGAILLGYLYDLFLTMS